MTDEPIRFKSTVCKECGKTFAAEIDDVEEALAEFEREK